MNRSYLKLQQQLGENELKQLMYQQVYYQSLKIDSYLNDQQFEEMSRYLKCLTHLQELEIKLKYKSIETQTPLIQFAQNVQYLTNLKSFSFEMEDQLEGLNINEMISELGQSLLKINELERLSLEFINSVKFTMDDIKSLKEGIQNQKNLKKFSVQMFMQNPAEEQQLKELLSSLNQTNSLTDLKISMTRYPVKKVKNENKIQQNLFNFSAFKNLINLELLINNRVIEYVIGLDSFNKSLSYLQNLVRLKLQINTFNLKQMVFSEFFDRLLQLPRLEELDADLILSNSVENQELEIGRNVIEKIPLKKLIINIINSTSSKQLQNLNLHLLQGVEKFNNLKLMELSLSKVLLTEQSIEKLFKNCQCLEILKLNLSQEMNLGFGNSFIEHLQLLTQLKELYLTMEFNTKLDHKFPLMKSISKLEQLQTILLKSNLSYLSSSQEEEFIQCFTLLKNLRNITLSNLNFRMDQTLGNIKENLLLLGHSIRSLSQVVKLNIETISLLSSQEILFISNNLQYLSNLQQLSFTLIYQCYSEYLLNKEDIANIFKGMKQLYQLRQLKVFLQPMDDDKTIFIREMSNYLENMIDLQYIELNFHINPYEKQTSKIKRQQKRLVSLSYKYE